MNHTKSEFQPGAPVVAYVRDSGGDDQELSVPEQVQAIQEWCDQEGVRLVRVFQDVARSGKTIAGRDEFDRMVEFFKRPDCPVDGLILWQFARFARNFNDAQYFKADIRRRGFIIHSMLDNLPSGIDGYFFEAASDWKYERWRHEHSLAVKRGLSYMVRTYKVVPGNPPRGFLAEVVDIGMRRNGMAHKGHRWVPDPACKPLIKKAFELRAAGIPYKRIETETGLYHSKTAWNHFFANRLYAGELRYGEISIQDYCEPIVDSVTWARVQEINQANLSTKPRLPAARHPRRVNSGYMLSGMVYCAICGSPMSGETINSQAKGIINRYYACNNRKRGGDCASRNIPQAALERAVLDAACDHILSAVKLMDMQAALQEARSKRQDDLTVMIRDQKRSVDKIEKKIKHLVRAIADTGHSSALLDELRELEKHRDLSRVELLAMEKTLAQRPPAMDIEELDITAQSIKNALERADVRTKREILGAFIDRISVERQDKLIKGLITFFYPIPIDENEFMPKRHSHQRGSPHTLDKLFSLPLLIDLK